MNLEEVFGNIYKGQKWGDGSESKPLSGGGSTRANALPYVDFVESFISKNSIRSVVDFGHGDWKMWNEQSFQNTDYLGIDVANGLSQTVQERFGNSKRKFKKLNILEKDLSAGDLLISKDVLQHLPTSIVIAFLKQMRSFQYVIICNDISVKRSLLYDLRNVVSISRKLQIQFKLKHLFSMNRDKNNSEIIAGDFTGIDLENPPYCDFLESFTILKIKDYDGPRRSGIKKRIYLLSRK
jgi:hypothetical protein